MNILVFGDSIAWGAFDEERGGWVERLKTYMYDEHFVYNMSISGDISRGVLYRMKYEIPFRKLGSDELAIIIAVGINDCSYNSSALQKAPINHFMSNISQIYDKAKEFTDNILFIGLTPVDNEKAQPVEWDDDLFYSDEYSQMYNQSLKMFCRKNEIGFADLTHLSKDGLVDGVHPNEDMHQQIFELVKDKIKYS